MKKRLLAFALLSCLVSIPLFATNAFPKDMINMDGAYGASSGFTSEDYYWKNAQADYQEKNWRYIFGPDTVNTYDRRIFDRYQLNIETATNTPWNAGCTLKVDPWSFVGVGHQTLYQAATGQEIEVKYKYWSNSGRTINETLRGNQGTFVNSPEIKVENGRIQQTPAYNAGTTTLFDTFSPGDSIEIDRMFRPLRKLWIEYKEDPLYLRVFPISDMHEALYSDDPLRLSNNKVYWAPSPWLWNFDPGILMTTGRVQQAKWSWDLPWYAEDSNRNYLTFLRGVTAGYKFHNEATIDFTAASPMSLWDDFEECNSIPMALRFKMRPSDDLLIGSTYTAKYGIYKQQLAGNNQVLGVDFDYNLGEATHLYGQYAGSSMYMKQLSEQQYVNTGYAYKAGVKSETTAGKNAFAGDLSFTQMSQNFAPGLSDYRDTRIDRDWGEHIWFDPIPKEDAAIRIGDSVDVNRIVFGANASASIADNLFKFYLNWRNAHHSDVIEGINPIPRAVVNASHGDCMKSFIENVTRLEAEYNPLGNLQFKGLALHKARPKTLPGLDPILMERYWDVPYRNAIIQDGMNADTMTFGGGAKVDLYDQKLTVFGIYEATNEPQDFPRRELYNPANYYRTMNNIRCQDMAYNMYSQDLFGLPPYPFYSIWKGVVIIRPVDQVQIRYTHVTNTNRNYAPLLDDNHNHDGIELTYVPMKKLTLLAGYSYSRVINITTAVTTGGRDRFYEPHSNIYAQAKYDINKDHNFIAQFGEYGMLQENLGIFGYEDPGMGYLNSRAGVLDTRCILRLFYQGKF